MNAIGVAWDAWRATRGGAPAIARRQDKRLAALVHHARTSSRFYAGHYRDLPAGPIHLTDLPTLPPVHKPALMARFDDWVTDPLVTRADVAAFVADPDNIGRDYQGRYVVFTTSGSTAEAAVLVQDRDALAVMFGVTYARSAGVLPLRLLFSVLDPLPVLVNELNDFQPILLGTYASALSVLTNEQEAGRLRICPLVITSGGELLLPSVKHRAEQVFGAVVTETFNASEATPLSLPCRLGRLHLNTDWYIVEAVDTEGNPVPNGQRSDTVLLSNLANHVQPLIRYELGDSVVIAAEPCSCGSPLPTVTPEGRTDEILKLPREQGGNVAILPMAIATVVEETPGVLRYQILQTAPTALTIRLDPVSDADIEQVWPHVRRRLN